MYIEMYVDINIVWGTIRSTDRLSMVLRSRIEILLGEKDFIERHCGAKRFRYDMAQRTLLRICSYLWYLYL